MIWGEAQQAKELRAPSYAARRPPNSRCQCSRKLSRRFALSMLRGGAVPGSGSSATLRGLCGVCGHQMGVTGPTGAGGRATWVLAGNILAAVLVLGAGPHALPPSFPAQGPGSPSRPGPAGPRASSQVRRASACVCLHPLKESCPVRHKIKWRERLNFVLGAAAGCVLRVPRNSRTGETSGLVATGLRGIESRSAP